MHSYIKLFIIYVDNLRYLSKWYKSDWKYETYIRIYKCTFICIYIIRPHTWLFEFVTNFLTSTTKHNTLALPLFRLIYPSVADYINSCVMNIDVKFPTKDSWVSSSWNLNSYWQNIGAPLKTMGQRKIDII